MRVIHRGVGNHPNIQFFPTSHLHSFPNLSVHITQFYFVHTANNRRKQIVTNYQFKCNQNQVNRMIIYLEENSPSTVLPPNRYSSSLTAVNVCRVKPGGMKVEFIALSVQVFNTASYIHSSEDKVPSESFPPYNTNPLPNAHAE